MALNYFYDQQIKRYLVRVVRAFSGIQYEFQTVNGPARKTIPARMATSNRQVASILKNNSENIASVCPQITVYVTGLSKDPNRFQATFLERWHQVVERQWDDATGDYNGEMGHNYTVKRLVPVPYSLKVNVDIWTSNEEQKMQILEQILMIFDHAIDIQSNDNPLDWTALTVLKIEDIQWDSRSIPNLGTEDEISISTLSFEIPIWINPPAKVNKAEVVQQIVMNIAEIEDAPKNPGDGIDWSPGELLSRVIVTLGDYKVNLIGNKIQIYGAHSAPLPETTNWITVLHRMGEFRPGISQFRIKRSFNLDDPSGDVVGVVDIDQYNPQFLYWNIDPETLPINDIAAIRGVIDPLTTFNGNGMPTLDPGDRFLITNDITPSFGWPGFEAKTNDIIEWNGYAWHLAWSSSDHEGQNHYLVNKNTNKQLQWAGDHWKIALDGIYEPGYWRIYL